MKTIILLYLSLFVIACSPCLTTTSDHHRDSVRIVTETLRDTIIHIAQDSSLLRALLECDSLGQAHLREIITYQQGEKIRPASLEIHDNILSAKAVVDSQKIYLHLKERNERLSLSNSENTIKTVEVNRLLPYQKVLIGIGVLSIFYAILRLILIITKKTIL